MNDRVQNLNASNFAKAMKSDRLVLVDFWADWCGPCHRFSPVFEKAAEAHPTIQFAKVDTEAQPELSAKLAITSIPTLMAFRNGKLLHRSSGALNKLQLEALITSLEQKA